MTPASYVGLAPELVAHLPAAAEAARS
jgi:hypothetical protein